MAFNIVTKNTVRERFHSAPRPEIWKDAPDKDWNNWIWQQQKRIKSMDQLEKVIQVTQEERDAFFVTLKEKGAEALLQQLRRAKRVGSLRTAQTVGWDIRLALEEPGKDGGRRVMLLTDRPIGFSEATNRPITIDYPFTVIDMQIPPKGFGQGTLAIAAKIIPAGKTVIVENFDTQPVQLNRIETRKLKKR